ncbi:hypothetical protein [Companilactobacillus sp. HBUAS59699]|uniref:hypothetical protein n=1 Tax=Companilactobacillus sp. HBUAS59699 TaxID=3109358 RepID=UPI002FF04FB2
MIKNKISWIDPVNSDTKEASELKYKDTQQYEDMKGKVNDSIESLLVEQKKYANLMCGIWTSLGATPPEWILKEPLSNWTNEKMDNYFSQNENWASVNGKNPKETMCENLEHVFTYDLTSSRLTEINKFKKLIVSDPNKFLGNELNIIRLTSESKTINKESLDLHVPSFFDHLKGQDKLRTLNRGMIETTKFLAGKHVDTQYKNVTKVNLQNEIKKAFLEMTSEHSNQSQKDEIKDQGKNNLEL